MPYEVHTPVFDGPFDLLLHLILREQVDLYEINLNEIVDAYLGELDRMEQLDLEVELLHAIQLAEVRINDLVQVDLVEINLLAQDQVQQQIERTVEHRRVDLVRHRRDPRRRVRGRGVDPTIA